MVGDLARQVILNTRPVHQQAALKQLLEADGATVLSFPAIEIVAAAATATAFHRSLVRKIAGYDILLFVSRNAVDGAFQHFAATDLPESMQLGVIGSATQQALHRVIGDRGISLVAHEPYNSEALLDAAGLQQVEGKRVLIFRGQSGRNLLGYELEKRCAEVEYCEVYRRALPQVDKNEFARLATPFPTLAVMTSNEGMHNLMQLVDDDSAARLCQIPWLLISERMRESARNLGHNGGVIIAENASDKGIFQSIRTWANP